jgi:two-component system chemotaxis sensor kinase CheA
MDDLISEFIDETVESLSALDVDLVRLEQEPDNKELLGNIFRLMHTVKGTCGFLGLSRLEKMAHAAENLLDNFRSGKMEVTEYAMTLLFMSIDRVRFLVHEVNKGGSEPAGDDTDIISAIESYISGAESGAVPAQSAPAQPTEAEAPDSKPDSGPEPVAAQDPAPTPAATSTPVAAPVQNTQNAQTAEAKQATEKAPEYLRVQMSVLEDLINMVSELVLTRNQLLQLVRLENNTAMAAPFQRLNRIVSDLQDSVMKTRMQPIGNAWSKLPRIVRDLSTELRKKITLEMSGEETELDRQVLELIKDPLTHMIRNSCDHGIEGPDERRNAGKPENGTIHLRAFHEGGFIVIQIQDDGKGVDAAKVAQKAVEKGMLDPDKVDSLTDKQILQFLMKPGFSTAEKITNVSGRGVGMDVVRANIENIGGTIDMESTVGKGTTFTIQIPLTLAIISALIVEIDGLRYAIPQLNMQELVRIDQSSQQKIEEINGKYVFRLRNRIIPLLDSKMLFKSTKSEAPDCGSKLVAVINSGSSAFGLIVDAIHDTEEIVIKSISSALKNTQIFSGNTILGDGQAIMILDPAGIARAFNVHGEASQSDDNKDRISHSNSGRHAEKASMLVFRAGAGALKAIPLELISRLQVFNASDITQSGDKMVVKYNDTLMTLNFIDGSSQKLGSDLVTTIILSDDVSESSMGLIIDEIIDIMEDHLNLTSSTARNGIIGSVSLHNHTVDVLDVAYFLKQNQSNWFATESHKHQPFIETKADNTMPNITHAGDVMGGRPDLDKPRDGTMRVLIVDDSAFFRNMLSPILTAAGYSVTVAEDAVSAIKLHDQGRMFDVILSDIEMPVMDGYQFVETMRNGSSWKDIPFIALTSHNTPQDIEYGYKKGFNQYIGKFDKAELIRTITKVMTGESVLEAI